MMKTKNDYLYGIKHQESNFTINEMKATRKIVLFSKSLIFYAGFDFSFLHRLSER